jgi:hypothetical protein
MKWKGSWPRIGGLALLLLVTEGCARDPTPGAAQVIRRYAAAEANQAVAVDERFFYAIDDAAIGKYEKDSGRRVAGWRAEDGGAIEHLNSGVVLRDELYCAHSNYPETPMVSSIEVFSTEPLAHVRSIALPAGFGSATWVDQAEGDWWVTFANYAGRGGEPGKGPDATTLVRFDDRWQQRHAWTFPRDVVRRWDGMSSSGGTWAQRGRLYTTGHHAREVYVLEVPASGAELSLRGIIAVESEGQGIALDRNANLLYSIQRGSREVLVSKLPASD